MAQFAVLLPGDTISSASIPTAQKRKIHPSIKQVSTITATTDTQSSIYTASTAGTLQADFRKKTASISSPRSRYIPQPGDLVIAQVRASSQETFHLYLTPFGQQAILPQLAFEGATKKTRPQLKPGDLVYAKIVSAMKGMDVELSCVNPATGKSEPDGLGPLSTGNGPSDKGGTAFVFDVSVGFAERLLKKQEIDLVMEDLGKKVQGGFEIAVGRNGRVWVSCPEAGSLGCIVVSRVLKEVDESDLTEREQKGLVGRIMSSIGTG